MVSWGSCSFEKRRPKASFVYCAYDVGASGFTCVYALLTFARVRHRYSRVIKADYFAGLLAAAFAPAMRPRTE